MKRESRNIRTQRVGAPARAFRFPLPGPLSLLLTCTPLRFEAEHRTDRSPNPNAEWAPINRSMCSDVSHGKHQTDPIQGMSSKAAESGQGSSGLRNLGEKKNETSDKVDPPADDDEGPGIEPNRPETETPVGGQRIPHIIQVHQDGSTALGHNAERLSATRGVAASVPRTLHGGGSVEHQPLWEGVVHPVSELPAVLHDGSITTVYRV